jgi:hypothetical protein
MNHQSLFTDDRVEMTVKQFGGLQNPIVTDRIILGVVQNVDEDIVTVYWETGERRCHRVRDLRKVYNEEESRP